MESASKNRGMVRPLLCFARSLARSNAFLGGGLLDCGLGAGTFCLDVLPGNKISSGIGTSILNRSIRFFCFSTSSISDGERNVTRPGDGCWFSSWSKLRRGDLLFDLLLEGGRRCEGDTDEHGAVDRLASRRAGALDFFWLAGLRGVSWRRVTLMPWLVVVQARRKRSKREIGS